ARRSLAQSLHRCRVRKSDESGRVKSFSRHDDQVLALDERLSELRRRPDAGGRQEIRDIREQIERALRLLTTDSGMRRQPAVNAVAPPSILVEHFKDRI